MYQRGCYQQVGFSWTHTCTPHLSRMWTPQHNFQNLSQASNVYINLTKLHTRWVSPPGVRQIVWDSPLVRRMILWSSRIDPATLAQQKPIDQIYCYALLYQDLCISLFLTENSVDRGPMTPDRGFQASMRWFSNIQMSHFSSVRDVTTERIFQAMQVT